MNGKLKFSEFDGMDTKKHDKSNTIFTEQQIRVERAIRIFCCKFDDSLELKKKQRKKLNTKINKMFD